MQADNLVFLQILRIPVCELWQVKDRRGTSKSRGALQVLFSKTLNQFLLKFNDFFFALDKSLQVTGTYSETGKWHSFLLPTFGGFFIIKALESQPGPLITNFETILENTTLYKHASGLEGPLGLYSMDEAKDIEMKESGVREGLGKITEAFSKMLHPSSDSDSHPNQKIVRSFNELLDVDSPGVPVVDVPRPNVDKYQIELGEIIRNHQGTSEWMELRGEKRPLETGIHSNLAMMGPSGLELKGAGAGVEAEKQSHHHHLLHRHEHEEGHHHRVNLLHHHHHHGGADNIQTCDHETGQDCQEVVGMENQRLPSYEVDNPKEHLMRGFRKASTNLDPAEIAKSNENMTGAGFTRIEETEDTQFTTGLFSNHEEILGKLRQGEKVPEALARDNLKFEKWGSNITNASDSTFKEDPFTGQNLGFSHPFSGDNLGFSLGTRTQFGNPNPDLTKENLDYIEKQQKAPAKNILGEKTNIATQQKPSEKTKSKTTTQEVDKENVGGSYVI